MVRDGSPEHRREVAGEVGDMRAAPVPERRAVGDAVEGEHLLHAAIAVGGHDEDLSAGNAHDDVMMKLPLPPVAEELVSTVSRAELVEERTEDERVGELLEEGRWRTASGGS